MKILLFLCSWGPHAAYQALQDQGEGIPPEVKMVRIPCTGRISKALLFKAFEMGADGAALLGCEPGSCRYGTGTETAETNVVETRGILHMLGLGEERLRWATFLPEAGESLGGFLQGFVREIYSIGKSPVAPRGEEGEHVPQDRIPLWHVLASRDIYACQDCGKCSSACPLTLSGKPFSPRSMAGSIILGGMNSPAVSGGVWSCLTCGLCYDRCPSAVDFPEFIRDLRQLQRSSGVEGQEAHGGFFHALMRTMASSSVRPRHWEWLPGDVHTRPDGKILFFGGCAPYFDIFFGRHLGVCTTDILLDGLRLMNFFDIHPVLLADERCCGHDLLWSGDVRNFSRLARLNADAIGRLGVEEVVTPCPECYRTLAHDYPAHGIQMNVKVTHLHDLLAREIDKGAVAFHDLDRQLTYQDPCRLNRLRGEAGEDTARRLIGRLRARGFQEMSDHGKAALCCGNCAWMGCDSYSKALQVKRLRQAHATGGDLLVTACPKCQIHLRCAMEDPYLGEDLRMEMMDLTSIIARTIHWE